MGVTGFTSIFQAENDESDEITTCPFEGQLGSAIHDQIVRLQPGVHLSGEFVPLEEPLAELD